MHLSAMDFDFPDIVDTSTGLMDFRITNAAASLNINKEARTIKNVIVAQVGEAKGHGVHVEASFLADAVNYAKKKMAGRVPVYMGHRWDPNFYQMGFLSNARVEGDRIIADLKVYESADLSPASAGMPDWFFSIAAEDPSAVNLSMSFSRSEIYQYDKDGSRKPLEFDYRNWEWRKIDEKGKMYVGFGSWHSTDIVHKGALTDTLFSAEGDTPASIAFTQFANSDGFLQWFRHNTDRFPQLNTYYQSQQRSGLSQFFSKFFSNHTQAMSESTTKPDAKVEASTTAPAAPVAPVTETTDMAALQASMAAMQTQITQLQATNTAQAAEIVALKAAPAADQTGVKTEDAGRIEGKEEYSYLDHPMNQKIKAMQRKKS